MASDKLATFTDANFEQDVLKSSIPVLVDFSAEWCPPCKLLAPMIDKLAVDYANRAKVGTLDTDSNFATASKFKINSIPAVLVFKGGQLVQQIVGLPKSEKVLRDALDANL